MTSTLTICTDPYPRAVSPKPAEPERDMEESQVHSDPVSNGLETTAGDGDEEMVEAEADEDAPSADADVHDAQVVDTEIDAQSADTEVHNAQVADTEVHDPQNADTEVHDIQNVDTEMQEEKASEAPESSPDQSSDSNSLREPCTTIKQNPPTPEQPWAAVLKLFNCWQLKCCISASSSFLFPTVLGEWYMSLSKMQYA